MLIKIKTASEFTNCTGGMCTHITQYMAYMVSNKQHSKDK